MNRKNCFGRHGKHYNKLNPTSKKSKALCPPQAAFVTIIDNEVVPKAYQSVEIIIGETNNGNGKKGWLRC